MTAAELKLDLKVFRDAYPLAADWETPDSVINHWFEVAGEFVSGGCSLHGKTYLLARQLMAAHLMVCAKNAATGNGGGGAVTSASEGSVSVSFAAPTTRNGWQFWLSQTPYGQQLWALLEMKAAGGLYIGGLPERTAVRKVAGVWY